VDEGAQEAASGRESIMRSEGATAGLC